MVTQHGISDGPVGSVLLAKVMACGVAGQVTNWIENWLGDRAGFRHVVAPGQPSVVEAHPTLEY